MQNFEDLKNGIVLDARTGLEWQAEPLSPLSWQEALAAAETLELGGHSDWRLPTAEELITLIDFERYRPASAFPGQWPVGGTCSWFWSSSSRVANTAYAWYVDFNDGHVDDRQKTVSYYVRCVRGEGRLT